VTGTRSSGIRLRKMQRANVRCRASVARVYPIDRFRLDANSNSRAEASVHHGIRIVSAPAEDGWFGLAHASRHIGESSDQDGAVWLCPFAQATAHSADYPSKAQASLPPLPLANAYVAFLDTIIEKAAEAPGLAPGAGDKRLGGLRQ
jgi:hypothetical protein